MAQSQIASSANSADLPPGNLPGALSSFVGRRREIAAVRQLLGEYRLLTLTGPGGCGKTRLALQVAEDVRAAYPDGVWLIEFAPLADEALVPQTVAATLGVAEQAGVPLHDALVHYLHGRRALLLFDNCEHLVAGCARLAATLLTRCPEARVLATSREPLGVPGEGTWAVPPLSLPDAQPWQSPVAAAQALAAYEQSEAVQLFVARARAAMASFELSVANGPWTAEICRRLDGMPLAIELAAARVRSYSVRDIAARLDDRFQLLTGRLRTVPLRQQTLEATLDWSHDLLSEEERIVFRRLSVFASGWTLDAAEAVCADGVTAAGVMALLSNLVDKSLVVVESQPDRRRYHYLETIRQYAQQRLSAAAEVDTIRDRHLDYFVRWAEANVPHLFAAGQPEWLERFDAEHDNLRAALDWSHGHKDKRDSNLRLATACGRFWQSRGYFLEGRERLQAALEEDETPARTPERAWALVWAAELAYVQSDYGATTALAQEGAAMARALGAASKPALAWSLSVLGRTATEMGEYPRAARLFEEALAINREMDNKPGIASMLMELGWVAMRQGDAERVEAYLNESLLLSRQLGDIFQLGFILSALGELAIRQGRFGQAQALLEESLTHRQRLGDQWGMAISFGSLGWAALQQREFDGARQLLGESLTIRLAIDDRGGIAWCLEKLAEVVAREAQALQAPPPRRPLERAVGLLGAAHHLRESLHSVVDMADLPGYNRLVGELRAALDEAAFDACWAEGGRWPLAAVRDLALEKVVLPAAAAVPPGANLADPDYGGLSARERETAALIAQGKSNREIAALMTVGPKTVETYVTRILNKLGFESRVQIALWAVERGLAATKE